VLPPGTQGRLRFRGRPATLPNTLSKTKAVLSAAARYGAR
jgi:hypothetical protein